MIEHETAFEFVVSLLVLLCSNCVSRWKLGEVGWRFLLLQILQQPSAVI